MRVRREEQEDLELEMQNALDTNALIRFQKDFQRARYSSNPETRSLWRKHFLAMFFDRAEEQRMNWKNITLFHDIDEDTRKLCKTELEKIAKGNVTSKVIDEATKHAIEKSCGLESQIPNGLETKEERKEERKEEHKKINPEERMIDHENQHQKLSGLRSTEHLINEVVATCPPSALKMMWVNRGFPDADLALPQLLADPLKSRDPVKCFKYSGDLKSSFQRGPRESIFWVFPTLLES